MTATSQVAAGRTRTVTRAVVRFVASGRNSATNSTPSRMKHGYSTRILSRCRGASASQDGCGTSRKLTYSWAVHLLLNRWLGRVPLNIDMSQHIAVDLTQAFDERALARYRWLVQHEHELTADQQLELQHYRMRSSTRNFHPLEATMVDYNRWSDADLHRYRQLLTRAIDAEVLPELALTDDELRELERYRLGLVERIDAVPVPVHNKQGAFVEQESRTSNITTLGPRPATGASDIEHEPELPVLSPAPARAAPRPKRPPAPSLTPEDLDGCGIYEINGIPSTIFGDHRAEQILSSEIPIEQAKREEQARRRTNMGRPGIVSPYL